MKINFSGKPITIKSKTIPEAILKTLKIAMKAIKSGTSKLSNLLIEVRNPEVRPLSCIQLNITDEEIIEEYYRAVTEKSSAKNALTSAISTLKVGEEAEIPLNALSKATGLITLRIQETSIQPTIIILNCKSLKQLNMQLGITQILQEDLSISLGLEPSFIVSFLPTLKLSIHEIRQTSSKRSES
ncbi:MAG: hypothetical protein DRJ18_01800 [Candidatus Methanomethylicota archaeon]|nr:hypothetical protein [Candidatus Culexmicrobium cathedralense]RLE48530.1 MAG: hypothetical protein DRJ18_01800 [Candidatus Verstraetearchaeota archaeon]